MWVMGDTWLDEVEVESVQKDIPVTLLNQYISKIILTMLNLPIYLSLDFRSLKVSIYKVKC